jgi:hypothetical protein
MAQPNPLQAQNPNPPNDPLETPPADPNAPPSDDATDDTDDDEGDEEPAPPSGDPAAALRSERGRRKALAKKLKQAEQSIAQMKPLADEYQTLLPHLPTIMEHAKRGRAMPPQQPAGPDPVEVQRLTEVAEAFGFTNDEGEPDLARASKVNRFVDALVKQRSAETMAPVAGQTAQIQAKSMREQAYKATDNTGRLYAKREYIDHVFSNLAPEALAGQHGQAVAQQALVMARGLGGPGEDPDDGTEPVFTERAGRRVNGLPNLSPSDHRLRQLRGKSEKDWQNLMKDDPNQTGDWSLE